MLQLFIIVTIAILNQSGKTSVRPGKIEGNSAKAKLEGLELQVQDYANHSMICFKLAVNFEICINISGQ